MSFLNVCLAPYGSVSPLQELLFSPYQEYCHSDHIGAALKVKHIKALSHPAAGWRADRPKHIAAEGDGARVRKTTRSSRQRVGGREGVQGRDGGMEEGKERQWGELEEC